MKLQADGSYILVHQKKNGRHFGMLLGRRTLQSPLGSCPECPGRQRYLLQVVGQGQFYAAVPQVGNAAGFGEGPNRPVITADWEADSGNNSHYTLINL
jgi:hypothetical protein